MAVDAEAHRRPLKTFPTSRPRTLSTGLCRRCTAGTRYSHVTGGVYNNRPSAYLYRHCYFDTDKVITIIETSCLETEENENIARATPRRDDVYLIILLSTCNAESTERGKMFIHRRSCTDYSRENKKKKHTKGSCEKKNENGFP